MRHTTRTLRPYPTPHRLSRRVDFLPPFTFGFVLPLLFLSPLPYFQLIYQSISSTKWQRLPLLASISVINRRFAPTIP
jgi:hypothetical protein